jgi:hypothetical protein
MACDGVWYKGEEREYKATMRPSPSNTSPSWRRSHRTAAYAPHAPSVVAAAASAAPNLKSTGLTQNLGQL